MDWYAELNDHRAVAALRREVGQHLRRHGLGASDFAAAALGPAPDELVHFGNRYEGSGP